MNQFWLLQQLVIINLYWYMSENIHSLFKFFRFLDLKLQIFLRICIFVNLTPASARLMPEHSIGSPELSFDVSTGSVMTLPTTRNVKVTKTWNRFIFVWLHLYLIPNLFLKKLFPLSFFSSSRFRFNWKCQQKFQFEFFTSHTSPSNEDLKRKDKNNWNIGPQK